MKKCSKCGAQMPDNATICTNCEASFTTSKGSRNSDSPKPETRLAEQSQPENTTTVVYQPIYIQSNPQAAPDGRGKAVASLVLGLFGLFVSIFGIPFSYGFLSTMALIPCVIGIFLAVKARNRIPVGVFGRSIATAGLTTSVLGTIISGIFTAIYACVFYGLWSMCTATPAENVEYYSIIMLINHLVH